MKLAFIGAGNMAGALMAGIHRKGEHTIGAMDTDPAKVTAVKDLYGGEGFADAPSAALWADVLFLAVKPHIMPIVMKEISSSVTGKPVVSVAAGITSAQLRRALPQARTMRTMPSTPAMVGEGITLISKEHQFGEEEFRAVWDVFASVGKTFLIEDKDMAAAFTVSSSSPAFFFLIIEAMADAAVQLGITRDMAYQLAAQAALGSGKMVVESGTHPAVLKDQVCSPGGTTIRGIAAMEAYGVRNAMMQAVCAGYARAKELEADG